MSSYVETRYCQDWCTANHEPEEIEDEDLTVHIKEFGTYDNGTTGVVEVWVKFKTGKVVDSGAIVETIELSSPFDVRNLAKDCLEAAAWLETKLAREKAQRSGH